MMEDKISHEVDEIKEEKKRVRRRNKDEEKKQVRIIDKKHKKKHKHYRPCSPAAYPSHLLIHDYHNTYHDVLAEEEETSSISSHESIGENTRIIGTPESASTKESYYTAGALRQNKEEMEKNFFAFRVHYLIIHIAIMLADGLQGTHLYVLYESYGYTVASLYCLGFVSGAITSPFIGPLVDKVGRRNSAIAYCILEIAINMLEQYDILTGLIISRVVGGITTNLLFTVFESWLVTEHRKRGFEEEKLEIVLRDSVVASNLSAIASGCLSHILAMYLGTVGPFEGAVVCTFVALMLVCTRWEENYGCTGDEEEEDQSVRRYMIKACTIIASDSKIFRIGLIQGLTEGALQTFVFLWSPALRHLASNVNIQNNWTICSIGMDINGEPAYGLIFGAFMFCGALGGMSEPFVRKSIEKILSVKKEKDAENMSNVSDITHHDDDASISSHEADEDNPLAAELLTFTCYIACALLLSVPITVNTNSPYSFIISLIAFLLYEFLVGLYLPCEGVLRAYFMPNDSICSLMTTLRVIVNVAVALGVISTNYIPFNIAFAACSGALILSAILQLSLIDTSTLSFFKSETSVKIVPSTERNISSSLSTKRPDVITGDSSMSTFASSISSNDDMFMTNKENITLNNGLRQRKVKN